MKISIITPCFNSASTIRDTIESVLSQNYQNVEYVVIDGGSKDETPKIVAEYGHKITKFVSEKDNGIYDAMNKGIKMATGDIVGILNSDDFYISEDILSSVASAFNNNPDVQAVYGDLLYVDADDANRIVRVWNSTSYTDGLFRTGWHLPHPTFFVKKNVYEKYGFFNDNFRIAADYELMLRLMVRHAISTLYIPKVFVKMRVGGASNASLFNIFKANLECLRAWKINELDVSWIVFLRKPFSKIKQFFKG